jgi:hypothetical protein
MIITIIVTVTVCGVHAGRLLKRGILPRQISVTNR